METEQQHLLEAGLQLWCAQGHGQDTIQLASMNFATAKFRTTHLVYVFVIAFYNAIMKGLCMPSIDMSAHVQDSQVATFRLVKELTEIASPGITVLNMTEQLPWKLEMPSSRSASLQASSESVCAREAFFQITIHLQALGTLSHHK